MNKKIYVFYFLIIFIHIFCNAQKNAITDNTIVSIRIQYPKDEELLIKAMNEMYKEISIENKELLEKKLF